MKIKVSNGVKRLASLLKGELYIVGGTVRNALLGLPQGDVDITGRLTPTEVKTALLGTEYHVFDDYASFGTLLIRKGRETYEYTAFRTDSYLNSHRPDSVTFTTDMAVDARRRDFTVNAIYYNVAKRTLEDPLNGIEDVKNRLLRSANGETTFEEDGLRVLRMIRLSGELGFEIEKNTFEYAKKSVMKVAELSNERIKSELDKILVCDLKYGDKVDHQRVYGALKVLEDVGALKIISPELQRGRGLAQNIDHHKYDVLDHSLYAAAYAKPEIRLYALFHDIGKPDCYELHGNFHEHDEIGAEEVRQTLTRLRYPRDTVKRAERLTKYHMKDLLGDMRERKLRIFFTENADILDDLISLKIADGYASGMNDGYSVTVKRWVELLKEMREEKVPFSIAELDIKGKEVIAEIGEENREYTARVLKILLEKAVNKEIKNDNATLRKHAVSALKEIKNGRI